MHGRCIGANVVLQAIRPPWFRELGGGEPAAVCHNDGGVQLPPTFGRARSPLIQDEQLPTRVQALLVHAQGHLGRLAALMEQCELDITEHGRQSDAEQRLCTLNGIDPITASAIGRERR